MEILSQFGFDVKLFVAQIVNFLVIAFIFKRWMYKPILEMLQKRNQMIEKGLSDAEKATAALEKAEEQKDEILKKAGKEAERILNEAKAEATLAKDEMMEGTRSEIEKMMAVTHEQIVLERENFKKEAKDMSLEISKQILDNAISALFDKKEKEILLKRSLSKLKNDTKTKN